jgi:hypothetical protein
MTRDISRINLDHAHCRAICEEIGERLHAAMGRELPDMPHHLRTLVDRLHELDDIPSPGIVPLVEDSASAPIPEVDDEMAASP